MLTKTGSIIETDGGLTTFAVSSGSVELGELERKSVDIAVRNGMDLDGFLGGARSLLGDSITFSPLKDSELQRRARNNDILAKIQELEANASVQAARSERLRMMREEYESLVKRYASSYRWPLRASNNYSSNGYCPNAYQYQPPNFQHSYIPSNSGGDAPPLLPQTVALSSTQLVASQQTRHELTPTQIFSTTGVNTDITGPIRPLHETDLKENANFREWNKVHFEGEKVIDDIKRSQLPATPEASVAPIFPPVLFTSTPYLVHEQPTQPVNKREDKDEKTISSQKTSLSMQMMLLDEDEDDEESFSHRRQSERSQNLQRFYNFQQPKAPLVDDTISISTMSSPGDNNSSYTTTESVLKKKGRETDKKERKKENETSEETVSFAPGGSRRRQDDNVGNISDTRSKYTKHDMTDSFSDSTSARQVDGRQRKLYVEQLSGKLENKRLDDQKGETKGIIKAKASHQDDDEDDLICSSPPTAGATSESLGDSLMDSVHKTPDARDDSELHGIVEVKEEDDENELDNKVNHDLMEEHQTDFVVNATAVEDTCIAHFGVNDTVPKETVSLDQDGDESQERINDAEETRSNNLSSSKPDVPAENEEGKTADGTHANDPVESNGEKNMEHGNFSSNEHVNQPMEQVDENGELDNTRFHGAEIMSGGTDPPNVGISKEKHGMISHAEPANSIHSSTSSSNSGASGVSRETNLRRDFATKSQRQLSSGSSSPSSSRQQSFDEQWDNASSGRPKGPNGSKGKLTPQTVHKRPHQTEEKMASGAIETSPVGPDNAPERLSPKSPSPPVSTSASVPVAATTVTKTLDPGKPGEHASPKTGKVLASSLSPSSSTSPRHIAEKGNSNGVTNFRRTFSNLKAQSSATAPVPSGPTGAKNTARRVRLKINYDDSESDSSEIGPVKALPGLVAGSAMRNQFNVSSSQPQSGLSKETGLATMSGKVDEKSSVKKQNEDDDFDDFFDI